MRIAIQSSSASVRRTLEAIVIASGHDLASPKDDAQLVLCDGLHPTKQSAPEGNVLTLVASASPLENEVSCPLRPNQLIQRLMTHGQKQTLKLGSGWSLDLLARGLIHPEKSSLTLTEKECALLKTLAGAQPKSLTREDLLETVWGMADAVDTHTLETHIYRLRGKLETLAPSPGDIVTEGGAYRFGVVG